jgi:histidine triad (HIT) family protein
MDSQRGQAVERGAEAPPLRDCVFCRIAATARSAGVADTGCRVITNTGPDAGREVRRLHWHVVGGARPGGMA